MGGDYGYDILECNNIHTAGKGEGRTVGQCDEDKFTPLPARVICRAEMNQLSLWDG